MSEPKIDNVESYESDDTQDPDYIPSQTPESEDYTSQESSYISTQNSDSTEYSIATSSQCSGSSDYSSSYFDSSSQSTQTSDSDCMIEQLKEDGSRSKFTNVKY